MKPLHKKIKTLLFFISISLFSANSFSATYYVNSSTGNDASAGTIGSPYKTFYKAYTMAASGDIINLTGTFDWTAADELGDASGTGYTLAKNLTIVGQSSSATFIQAASTANTADRRVFTFNANVTIQNLTIRNGKYGGNGGGMYASGRTLVFDNVAIENNYGVGGGSAFFSSCTVTYTNCTFEGNNSTSYGAAFYAQQSIMTLTNCTLASNTASSTILQVENYNMAGYVLNLTNVTVAYNTVTTTSDYHGHVYQQGTETVRMKNCLFAKNLSPNTATKHDYLNYSTIAYTVAEYNLIENDYNWAGYGLVNGVNNNIIGNQANLNLSNTLAYNGSTNGTKTLAISCGSPAINAGSATANGIINVPTTDQRGTSRNGATDIGSYENFSSSEIAQSGTLSAFSKCGASPSSNQTINVQGCNLTNNISITAPTGFEISTNSSTGFAGSLTLTQSGGSVASTTIYVRMTAASTGTNSGNIDISSAGVTTISIAISGVAGSLSTGTISANQIVCYNGSASDIILTGSSGTIQWQSSSNNSTWSNIVGATSATLTTAQIGTLTTTKFFRAVVTSGSCSGNSSTVTVNVNNGLAFDGSGDFVTIGTTPLLNLTSDFTIETWVYVPASPKYSINTLFSKNYPNLANPGYMFGFNNWNSTDLKLVLEDGVTAYASTKTVVAGQWNHVAVVISGNGTICTFYVNASAAGSFPVSFVGDASSIPATIGSMDLGGSYSLSGTLDEMRVWNVARTQQQLIDNLDNPLIGNESGLVAYYDFNQGVPSGSNAGLTLMDKTANNLSGTFTGISLSGSTSNFVTGNHLSVISPSTTLCLDATLPKLLYGGTGLTPSSYQWYSNTSASTSGASTISGETTNYYNSPTSTAGTVYYYLNAPGTCAASSVSNFASVVIQNTAAGTITGNDYLYLGHTGTYTSSLAPAASSPWVISNTTYATTTSSGVLTAVSAGTTSLTYTSSLGCVSEKTINVVPVEWIGTTSNDWNTGSNWNGQYVPTVITTIAINSSASNDLHLDANKTITNLTFNGANKKLVLGNFDLTATTINNANATNFVQSTGTGKLKLTIGNSASATFPVGNTSYNPVTITNNSGASDVFSAQVVDAVYLNGASGTEVSTTVVDRTWNISKTNANGGSGIGFVFNWNSGEVINGSFTDPRMNHYTGSNWEVPSVASTVYGTNSLTVTGYTGTFSPFAISEGTSALPVEMVYFHANCKGSATDIQWQTATEHNSSHFILEKSVDGINWLETAKYLAAGNSTTAIDYEYVDDAKMTRDLVYYRLLQFDIDGESVIYGPISSACQEVNEFDMVVAPNPNNGQFTLQIASIESQDVKMELYNSNGLLVEVKTLSINEGVSMEHMDLGQLKPGIYNLHVQHSKGISNRKISIQ